MRTVRSEAEISTRAVATGSGWILYVFFAVQILAQIALAFTPLGGARVWVRASSFGVSLLLLIGSFFRNSDRKYPAGALTWAILGWVVLSILHPMTNSWLAGAVHAGLYVAILGPLIWVPRFGVDAVSLNRAILGFWAFHTLSAAVGIVQVYVPDFLQPNVTTILLNAERNVEGLRIVTSTGEVVLRPMGLSDVPGGAAAPAGLYAVVLGVGLLITHRRLAFRVAGAASMFIGMAAIYLSQVRIALIISFVTLATLAALLSKRRRLKAATIVFVLVIATALAGLALAVWLARDAVIERFSTLVEDRPTTVYYENRGSFLETTLDIVLDDPFGSGLGRYGMTSAYFGDQALADRKPIWVEIQWTGWVVDGGFALVVMYVALLLIALRTTLRTASIGAASDDDYLTLWSLVVAAYTVGMFALTFSYPIFISQGGMEFWVLSASIFSVAARHAQAKTTDPHEGTNGNVPPGGRRLRPDGRHGHGQPGARPLPGHTWRYRPLGQPPDSR